MAIQEQKKDYHVTKDFSGVNTKANRTAIQENEFAWLENAMPIGQGNIRIVPGPSTIAGITFSASVAYAAYANIGTTNYYLAFMSNGGLEVVNLTTNIRSTVAAAATFSTSGVVSSNWNNTNLLIIDPVKGYFQWDGTNLVHVGSLTFSLSGTGTAYTSASTATVSAPNDTGGILAVISLAITGGAITGVSAYGTGLTTGTGYTAVPTVTLGGPGSGQTITAALISQPGTAIASFSGRVWIADGRTLYFTAAGTNNDFYSASAGNIIFQDSTLVGDITQIISANNFLYVFGIDSINVISDVRISSTGTTLFTNTNISAAVGTDLSYAMLAYFRSIVFMNRYGVYALVGSTTSKLSDALDGIFPYIDFTKTISAGQVLIYNILCASFCFTYNDPLSSARVIQAVYFDKKWFFTSQGTFTFVVQVPINGSATMYATTGTNLQKMFQDSTSAISSKVQTSLLGMGDIIRDKQALKFGVEAILTASTSTLLVSVDSESSSSPITTLSNFSTVIWQNNTFQTVSWINNSLATVTWGNSTTGYYLYRHDAQQWGKYIGLTTTSTSPNFIISGFQYETEKRASF